MSRRKNRVRRGGSRRPRARSGGGGRPAAHKQEKGPCRKSGKDLINCPMIHERKAPFGLYCCASAAFCSASRFSASWASRTVYATLPTRVLGSDSLNSISFGIMYFAMFLPR